MPIHTDDFSVSVCKALGLDPSRVKSIYISIEPQKQPTVEVVLLMKDRYRGELVDTFKRYRLLEMNKEREL